jgi:protein gp37
MGVTSIEWCHYTFNPWHGCTRVSPGCENCYAERLAKRFGVGWGVQAERRFFGEKHWAEPLKWNRRAADRGVRERVFCASMSDVFEPGNEAHFRARRQLGKLIDETPWLDWLLLTKRPQHMNALGREMWHVGRSGWPSNVWAGTTVEDQERADERIPELLQVPARVRFLSCEPLLGPVDLSRWLAIHKHWKSEDSLPAPPWAPPYPLHWWKRQALVLEGYKPGFQWVIAGGESGAGARPMHPDWARSLRDQCTAGAVPFLFKQWGGVLKKKTGRELDGRTWDEVPA